MSHHLSHGAQTRSDQELLEDFLAHQDSEAFAHLVERHGPMILGVCRRLLRNQADAEDAFQATFLTLLRKGHSIRQKMALPNWLYRVAVRISLRQRSKSQKHSSAQTLTDVPVEHCPADELAWREAAEVLDRELHGLPENYRSPLLLCCIEGRSYEEAAEELGCPVGTLAVRLMRAREMLRKRLVRRGLVLGAGFLAAQAFWPKAEAAIPPELLQCTISGGKRMLLGKSAGSAISPKVAALMRSQEKAPRLLSRGLVTGIALGLISIGVGIFVVSTYLGERKFQASVSKENLGPQPNLAQAAPPQPPQQPQEKKFIPGLWIGRWNGREVVWAPSPPIGPRPGKNEPVVEIAFVGRLVPPQNVPAAFLLVQDFAWLNLVMGV
ncbi:MAG TPA: RNA polymerase sigma factor [Gemmataceae bacterium]|nr:RNA polymerase sigma factor [Gemmataceae bacterium]